MRAAWIWQAALMLALCTPRADASEFWDEVRTPGLRAWRQDLARAREALAAQQLDQAIAAADNAVQRLPERAEGYVLRARVRARLVSHELAVEDLDRALELAADALDDPGDGADAAELYARALRFETSAAVLGRVLGRMRAGNARRGLYGLYGDVLMALGPEQLQAAIRAYREALRESRYDPRASLGLALALHRSGETIESRDLARAVGSRGRVDTLVGALPLPPSERTARRALALQSIDDVAEARAAWQSIAEGAWLEHAAAALRELETTTPRSPAPRSRR